LNTGSTVGGEEWQQACQSIIEAGRFLNQRGWVPATSSNFSLRLASGEIAITASGYHKGELTAEAVMRVDADGAPLEARKPSAETLLHTALYKRFADIGAVLHTHSVHATVLSRLYPTEVLFEDYELLKAFRGVETHETRIAIPIFPNDQDIPRLSARIDRWLGAHPPVPGYLIAGHGLYTWGRDMKEALRHVEAFEVLLECELITSRVRHP
jgi:methylthioribulose-1-phosphate dehydratase